MIRGESPSNLRVAEILKKGEEPAKVWCHADRATVRNYDNAEMTAGLRRLVPEWHDKGTGQVNLRPTARDLGRGSLEEMTGSFARGDINIALASFAMHSDGKIPGVQVGEIEKWSRHRSKSDERALRALPGKAVRRSLASQPASRETGQLARDQGLLRGGLSERAPSDYGRALVTKRRGAYWTSSAHE